MSKLSYKLSLVLIFTILSGTSIAQVLDRQKLALVAKNEQSGMEFFVDPTSIEKYGDERVALIQERKPDSWNYLFERTVIDRYDAKINLQAFRCKDNTMAIYSSVLVDEKGNVIKQEIKYPYGDPRVVYTPIPTNSIAASIYAYVCSARVSGSMAGSASTAGSRLIKGAPNTDDWANLGPDSTNEFALFLLKTSIIKKGGYLGYTTKAEYQNPKIVDDQPVKVVVRESVYDCKNSRYKNLKSEYLSPQGNILSEAKIDPEFANWENANKGSFAEKIGSVYCKQ